MSEGNLLKVKNYSISNEFFEKGYSAGNGPCNCSTNCCKGGVWVDIRERDLVLSMKELIKRQMDETQTTDEEKWFEPGEVVDLDFPSGKATGTEVVNDKCAFLDRFGRCSIQMAAVADGRHKWVWKPLYCILFPVEVSNGIVGFDPMLQGEYECCSPGTVFEKPLFAACQDELVHILGNDGYKKLEEHYTSLHGVPVGQNKG